MIKRIISITLAVISISLFSVYAEFTDIAGYNEETREAINVMVEKRYINGTSDSEFSPDKMISMAELAAVMLRILNKMDNNAECPFWDVKKYNWYYYTAASSSKEGIISGFEDGSFRGDEYITREQLIAVLARVLIEKNNAVPPNLALTYKDEVSDWAQDYVRIAKDQKIFDDYGDNTFGGSSYVTRASAAVMIMRTYEKIKDSLEYDSFVGENAVPEAKPKVIVLDAGHGKLSGYMSDEEKAAEGWIYNSQKGGWGEWRHWKSGTTWQDCNGYGCSGRGNCWYPMGNGDRSLEPDITLSNVNYAKEYLEKMGYEVRLSRPTANDNPSMTKRLTYCYPQNDTSKQPDADLFICIHSNAGGGRGSAYIALNGNYDQAGIKATYAEDGNMLGQYINNRIVYQTNLGYYGNGRYDGLPELVLFSKCPITIAYLEIGFFDNKSDLQILRNESERIGQAIAEGIDEYCNDYLK